MPETELTDEIVCPYCGDITSDNLSEYGESGTIHCDECEHWFDFTSEASITYTTSKTENQE